MPHGLGFAAVTPNFDQIPVAMTLRKAMPVAMRDIEHRIRRAPVQWVATQRNDALILEGFVNGPLIDQEIIPGTFVKKRCIATAAKTRVPQR